MIELKREVIIMKQFTTGDRLRQLMQERRLRQVDIVRACQPYCKKYNVRIGTNDICQYLSGFSEPKQDKIYVIALALNVSEAWLMGFDVPPERQRPAAPKAADPCDRLIQKLNRLDEIDRAKIEERIDVLLENEKYNKKEVV